MAGYTGREQQLQLEIESCADGPVLAGLLTELAGLHIAAGRMDEAGGLLQQAYAIRMQEFTAGCAGASINMVAAAPQQPVQQSAPQQPEQPQQQQQLWQDHQQPEQQQPPLQRPEQQQQLWQDHQHEEQHWPEQQQQLWQDHQQPEQQQPPLQRPEQQQQQQLWQDHQHPEQQQPPLQLPEQQQQQQQQQLWQDHQEPEHQQPQQQPQTELWQNHQPPEQQQLEQQQRQQQQLDMLRHQEPDSSSEGTDTAEDIAPVGPESSSSQQSAAEHVVAAAGSSKAFVEQQADETGHQSDGDEAWDNANDWEPDLSSLRTANSFERSSQQQQVQQASTGPAAGRSSASKADSAGWWRPSSSGGSRASSQPRGRGESKCGAASDADSDSGWDLAGVANQPHIVEIHNLNRSVKTSHIDEFLLEYMWGGTTANVKWVDDEHALAVFPCAEAAQVLLDSSQKEFKVRPYNKASGAALQIAADELLPPRSARPKTTTAVARRLISNALGNREVRDRAAERELADMRKANKQGKQQRQQQLNEAWGDD